MPKGRKGVRPSIVAIEPYVRHPSHPQVIDKPYSRRAWERYERGPLASYTITHVRIPSLERVVPESPDDLLEMWWQYKPVEETYHSTALNRKLPKATSHFEKVLSTLKRFKANVLIIPDDLEDETEDIQLQMARDFVHDVAMEFGKPADEGGKFSTYLHWLVDLEFMGSVQPVGLTHGASEYGRFRGEHPLNIEFEELSGYEEDGTGIERSYTRIWLWLGENFEFLTPECLQTWQATWEEYEFGVAKHAAWKKKHPRSKIRQYRGGSRQRIAQRKKREQG